MTSRSDGEDNVLIFDPDKFVEAVRVQRRAASRAVHPSAHARDSDPITSHLAAHSVGEDTMSTQLSFIEREFHHAGERGFTDEELCDFMAGTGWAPSGIRTRRNTLSEMAVLAHRGYRDTKRGRRARVWVHAEFVE